GIKFPWFVFFQKDSGLRPPEPPLNMRLAMLFFSALCIGLGVFYAPLYALLPYAAPYVPYDGAHVVGQLQLLLFSGLVFFLMLPMLRRTLTITLDVDWLYRRAGPVAAKVCADALSSGLAAFGAEMRDWRAALLRWTRHWHGPDGVLARTLSTGAMALWISALLAVYLVMYYV
ncbi:MAG: Na+/H+ antiporter subunit D, partial [Betaproteobacteria bacterium]|nr:Na+/H+ antiporter subunit D [Betaproteobacteria bacterium]